MWKEHERIQGANAFYQLLAVYVCITSQFELHFWDKKETKHHHLLKQHHIRTVIFNHFLINYSLWRKGRRLDNSRKSCINSFGTL